MNAPEPSEHDRDRFRVFEIISYIRRAILESKPFELDGFRQYLAPAIEKAWGADATREIREGLLKIPPDAFTLERLKEVDDATAHSQFKNGWGSAPRVWTALCGRYADKLRELPAPKADAMFDNWSRLFEHCQKLPLEPWEYDVMIWTYDRFIVKREHFAAFARSLATFDRERPTEGISHLRAVGDTLLRILETEPEVTAAAYWHTTVSDCPWRVLDEGADDRRPYDLSRDEGHFFHEPAR